MVPTQKTNNSFFQSNTRAETESHNSKNLIDDKRASPAPKPTDKLFNFASGNPQ